MIIETGIVKDARYMRHKTGGFHPESPQRLEAVYDMLESSHMSGKFIEIESRYASEDEIGMIHSQSYIERVASTSGKKRTFLDPDTETSPESFDIAKLAVGGLLNAVDSVVEGHVNNAFAFIRPPGHHAEKSRAAGFCIFNNVAVGALHAIKKYNMKKILIVDWDLHHGNGTQHSFYDDPRVLYFSTHQYPFYPGSGSVNEIGHGAGLGYTINVPLRRGPGDAEFLRIFKRVLEPVALEYKPDMVMLSAGFDIYFKDPLGGMKVTPAGFRDMIRVLLNIADACCHGRFVVTLEGGYNIQGLRDSVKSVLLEMKGETYQSEQDLSAAEAAADRAIDKIIEMVINQIKPVWHVF
jgi:acetoin utilization deacetylase AcuC-like enzyme